MSDVRPRVAAKFKEIQAHICQALTEADGSGRFHSDIWNRVDVSGNPGGGGDTRVLADGAVFEKAGVNFSEVFGHLPSEFAQRFGLPAEQTPFYATGVSLVIHPANPMVPTTHSNWRYFEAGEMWWFGGGSDLTPYLLFEEDAKHFHLALKSVCDKHDPSYYSRFKKWCDDYFYLSHRSEHRGIGGIFFDHIGKNDGADSEKIFSFVTELGMAFPDCYVPIVKRTAEKPFTPEDRQYQLQRRGRYVEFNLLYDRGTQFGLSTGGRVESILMSLPPIVRWDYNQNWDGNERYAPLLDVVRHPREWV